MKILYKLKIYEYLILFFIIVIGNIFIATQKYYIPDQFRALTLFLFLVILLSIYFLIIRPINIFLLSRFLSILLGLLTLVLIIIQDIIIKHLLTTKFFIIIGAVIIVPFVSGFIYKLFKK
jgi:hypothetical protein